jgi:2-amino-4-hydroxy-6-hydroxymethyldihydropteridine diphosphokinase
MGPLPPATDDATEAIFSLGSNLGARLDYLCQARAALAHLPETRLTATSHVYATEAVTEPGAPPDTPYLNAIVIVATRLDPFVLATRMHDIETALGRRRTDRRYAPRTLDIDLIAFGTRQLQTATLQIPHPRAHLRRFVCAPLAELRPALILPGQRETLRTILSSLPAAPAATLAEEQWTADVS